MLAATNRVTLASATVYNLYELMTKATYAGISSLQQSTLRYPSFARAIQIQNHSGGTVWLATDAGVSSSHHFREIATGGVFDDIRQTASSADLSQIWIMVSADNTIVGIRTEVD